MPRQILAATIEVNNDIHWSALNGCRSSSIYAGVLSYLKTLQQLTKPPITNQARLHQLMPDGETIFAKYTCCNNHQYLYSLLNIFIYHKRKNVSMKDALISHYFWSHFDLLV